MGSSAALAKDLSPEVTVLVIGTTSVVAFDDLDDLTGWLESNGHHLTDK